MHMTTTEQYQSPALFRASIASLLITGASLAYSISTLIEHYYTIANLAIIVTLFSLIILTLGFAGSIVGILIGITPREHIPPSYYPNLNLFMIRVVVVGMLLLLAYLYMMGSDLINLEHQYAGALSFQFLLPLALASLAMQKVGFYSIFD